MKTIKLTVLMMWVLLSAFISSGQSIQYDYDDAGNRIKRYEVVFKSHTNDDSSKTISDNIGDLKVKVSPNPTVGFIQVSVSGKNLEQNSMATVNLFDMTGKLLQRHTTAGILYVDLSQYANGIYYMQIQNGKDKRKIKIIKQ